MKFAFTSFVVFITFTGLSVSLGLAHFQDQMLHLPSFCNTSYKLEKVDQFKVERFAERFKATLLDKALLKASVCKDYLSKTKLKEQLNCSSLVIDKLRQRSRDPGQRFELRKLHFLSGKRIGEFCKIKAIDLLNNSETWGILEQIFKKGELLISEELLPQICNEMRINGLTKVNHLVKIAKSPLKEGYGPYGVSGFLSLERDLAVESLKLTNQKSFYLFKEQTDLPYDLQIYRDNTVYIHYYDKGEVGHGSYKNVFKSLNFTTGQKVANILVRTTSGLDQKIIQLDREIEILKNLHDIRSLAHFRHYHRFSYPQKGEVIFVAQRKLYSNNLRDYLEENPSLSFIQKLKVASKIIIPVLKMHKRGYVHLDIKRSNFLVDGDDSDNQIVLNDFGTARNRLESYAYPVTGTAGYVPVDLIKDPPKDFKGSVSQDIFALGMVLYQLFRGEKPSIYPLSKEAFKTSSEDFVDKDLFRQVFEEYKSCKAFLREEEWGGNFIKNFVMDMLNPAGEKRPTDLELESFLNSINEKLNEVEI